MVLNASVLIWLQQYLIRRITPEEYSLLPLVMALMAFIPLMKAVLSGGIGRYVTVAYARGDDEGVTIICSTMLPLLIGGALLILGAGTLLVVFADRALIVAPDKLGDARLMLAMLFFTAALELPLSAFSSGFMVRQQLVYNDLIDFGFQLLRLSVLFTLLMAVSTRVLWVVTATCATEAIKAVVMTVISRRLVPSQTFRRNAIRWEMARELISYGGWSMAHQVATTARDSMDPIILNRYASALDVATYHAGGIPGRQLRWLTGPLVRPFIPVLAALDAVSDKTKVREIYLQCSRYCSWLVFSAGIPLFFFADEVMFLYLDGKYPEAGTVMALILWLPMFGAMNALGPGLAAATGKIKGFALREIATHAFNLLLTFALVAWVKQGAIGSAIASLAAMVLVEMTLTWTFCVKLADVTFSRVLREIVGPVLLPAVPTAAFCWGALTWLNLNSWLPLLASAAVAGLTYLGFAVRFSLTANDKRHLSKVTQRLPPGVRNFLALNSA